MLAITSHSKKNHNQNEEWFEAFWKVMSWRDGEGLHKWLSTHPFSKQSPEEWLACPKIESTLELNLESSKGKLCHVIFFIWICVRIPAFVSQVHTYICSPVTLTRTSYSQTKLEMSLVTVKGEDVGVRLVIKLLNIVTYSRIISNNLLRLSIPFSNLLAQKWLKAYFLCLVT